MGFSYGYNRMETWKDYHTNRELLLMLTDIVSRGGNLLLDIGPTADGRIPVIMEERLIEMGNWLRPNAEAIYGTHAPQRSRQWSAGTIPHMEDKEFMAEYDISEIGRYTTGWLRASGRFLHGQERCFVRLASTLACESSFI